MLGRVKMDKKEMPAPKKGRKPKRITGKGNPGGPHTPGAKAKREAQTSDSNNE